jgi:hypothetical protein
MLSYLFGPRRRSEKTTRCEFNVIRVTAGDTTQLVKLHAVENIDPETRLRTCNGCTISGSPDVGVDACSILDDRRTATASVVFWRDDETKQQAFGRIGLFVQSMRCLSEGAKKSLEAQIKASVREW